MTKTERMKTFAPVVLRIGLALVFLWFGSQQLAHTQQWVRLIPEWVTGTSGLAAETLVHFNGAFEIVFGLCLLFGFFFRVVSLFLALHMIHLALTVGYSAIGVRDFGLAMSAVSLFLLGPHAWTIDNWLCTRFEQKKVQG